MNINILTDKPASLQSEDCFQRYEFSKRIASIVAAPKIDKSLIVGLYGKWGEGKTTVMNFIQQELPEETIIVNFNPWLFSDEHNVLKSFFASISEASSGQISTGWYPNNCNGCQQQGGFPFSNKIDTLAFWYKYAPQGGSTVGVNMNFKNNGNNIGNAGTNLPSSTNYQYMEIPFNVGALPDSVIINIQSSQWQDSLLSHVGSDLKIDEMHFKSQPLSTGIFNYPNQDAVSVFPNPASKKLTISLSENSGKQIDLTIINNLGQQVLAQTITNRSGTTTLDISHFAKGIYILRMTTDNQSIYDKKIIIAK